MKFGILELAKERIISEATEIRKMKAEAKEASKQRIYYPMYKLQSLRASNAHLHDIYGIIKNYNKKKFPGNCKNHLNRVYGCDTKPTEEQFNDLLQKLLGTFL